MPRITDTGQVSGSMGWGRFQAKRNVVKFQGSTGSRWLVAVMIVALVSACNAPSTPTPTSTPPAPPPTLLRYHVSGIVTDETGSPIVGASVSVDYSRGGEFSSPSSFCPMANFCWLKTVTNDGGHYEFVFEPGPGPVFGANGAGVIYSWPAGYEGSIQVLPRGSPDIVQNLRLRRSRTVSVGQSITVSIEPESSLCSDLEDWYLLTRRCENFEILVGKSGTLTVDARPTEASGIVPVPFFATTGDYTSRQDPQPGTVSIGVLAGKRYRVFVGIPSGIEAQRYDVSTSLR